MTLFIDDGDPWWLSPNVWAVDAASPGDPSPGVVAPEVGSQYLLKATVRNDASAEVENARVDFFWANPSIGITRASASAIGSAFVTVGGNSTAEALCLVTWVPSFVNGGHVCIVAAVVPPGMTPGNALDAASDPSIAQRNFDLVVAAGNRFSIPFDICNPSAETAAIEISVEPIKHDALRALGVKERFESLDAVRVLGFTGQRCPDGDGWRAEAREPLVKLEAMACTGLTLVGEVGAAAAAFSIVGRSRERVIGGITVLVRQKAGKAS